MIKSTSVFVPLTLSRIIVDSNLDLAAYKLIADHIEGKTHVIEIKDFPSALIASELYNNTGVEVWFTYGGGAVTTTATTYTKKRYITLGAATPSGTLKINFDLFSGAGGTAVLGKLYKNGVAVGTERSTTLTTPGENWSEEISGCVAGDTIELWIKSSNGVASAQNAAMNILGTKTVTAFLPVGTKP